MYQVTTTYLCPACGSSEIEVDDETDECRCECGHTFDLADADCKESTTSTPIGE